MINRKEYNLLVEGWRNFLNEEENKKEEGLGNDEIIHKYLLFIKSYFENLRIYDKFGKYISTDVKRAFKNVSEGKFEPEEANLFGHFIVFLHWAVRAYCKVNESMKEKMKRKKEAEEWYKKATSLENNNTFPMIVYFNWKPAEMQDIRGMEEVKNYITRIMSREFNKANANESASPFKETIDNWKKLDSNGNLISKS